MVNIFWRFNWLIFFSDDYLILMFAPVHCPTTVKFLIVKLQLGFRALSQKYIAYPFLKNGNAHAIFEMHFRVVPGHSICWLGRRSEYATSKYDFGRRVLSWRQLRINRCRKSSCSSLICLKARHKFPFEKGTPPAPSTPHPYQEGRAVFYHWSWGVHTKTSLYK